MPFPNEAFPLKHGFHCTYMYCLLPFLSLTPKTFDYPTNIGIVRCTVSVATIVVVGAGVDI